MDLLSAYQLASELHAGQVDKAGRPYIEHLTRVCLRVMTAGGDLIQQIASLLHDALEDKKTTVGGLRLAGVPEPAIALIVVLSRGDGQSYADYIQGIKVEPRAVLIKKEDLADNSDPLRLALLPADVAKSLVLRYSRAIQNLGS
ncbi:HD domain-containing protein [Curvibacter delicatus]|jgi:hypothetical protein|uniref:HD domain-containing protein n=1 Tax=Curvibacter delicatus TaxID=80879 RepID=UPI00083162A5|nr:HD domain-containing protein [Curvibacter delicatus]